MRATGRTGSNRVLIIMGISLLGLLVLAAIVAALRGPAQFAPGTPEYVTQQYIQAVLDEDAVAAHALLSADLQRRCDVDDLEDRHYWRDAGQITLLDSEIEGSHAVIEVEITASYSDGAFDFDQSAYEERFELDEVDGEWRLAELSWPFYWCSE